MPSAKIQPISPTFPLDSTLLEGAARFWSNVDITANPDECWNWLREKQRKGYGVAYFNGARWRANRLAWCLANRQAIQLQILHSCDNPSCCNPSHLREGTAKDNVDDMVERGRQRKPKMSPLKMRVCELFFKEDKSKNAIARELQLSRTYVCKILKQNVWKEAVTESFSPDTQIPLYFVQ